MNRLIKTFSFFFLLLCSTTILLAQNDSIPALPDVAIIDSLVSNTPRDTFSNQKISLKRFLKKDYPDPNKAALSSLILPGGGQAYNKKYWKIPIVYAGLGTAIYFAVQHEKDYRYFRDNYRYRVDGDSETNAEERLSQLSDETLKTIRNRYDKWRQQLYAGTLGVWLLQAMDAYVDAHLASFDVDEDLTLFLDPSASPTPLGNVYGLGLNLKFQSNDNKTPQSLISIP